MVRVKGHKGFRGGGAPLFTAEVLERMRREGKSLPTSEETRERVMESLRESDPGYAKDVEEGRRELPPDEAVY